MATKKAATVKTDATPSLQPATRKGPPAPPSSPSRRSRDRRTSPSSFRRLAGERTPMRPDCRLEKSEPLAQHLSRRVIGQDDAIDALVCSWSRVLSGLRDPRRPLLTGMLLGPTGVGKTETALALAEALFGSVSALHRINCEEYAHGHEVAKLLGSPPGYVGGDIDPLLSQQRVDLPHWQMRQAGGQRDEEQPALIERAHDASNGLYSIILFDEIEKAHPTLWNALLGILEEGQVTLGNNRTTDLTRAIILMTSNVGSREMSQAMERVPIGFRAAETPDDTEHTLRDIASEAARNVFPIEFLNRFDEVLVYRPLQSDHLGRIFDKFLADINRRALEQAGVPLLIKTSPEARAFVIDAVTDPTLGARPLRRATERLIVDPVSRLLASAQITAGDVVEAELEDGALTFYRWPRSADSIVA